MAYIGVSYTEGWLANYNANLLEIANPQPMCQRRATAFTALTAGKTCPAPLSKSAYPTNVVSYPASSSATPTSTATVTAVKEPTAQELQYLEMAKAAAAGPKLAWPFWAGSAAALMGLVMLWRER